VFTQYLVVYFPVDREFSDLTKFFITIVDGVNKRSLEL